MNEQGQGTQDAASAAAGAASERFDSWAIVELMGHRKMAGRVSEQLIGGSPLLRIDVPELIRAGHPTIPGFTQFYGVSSIYCLTPTTEEIARRLASGLQVQPVSRYELPMLPSGPITDVEVEEDNDDSDTEETDDREER